MVVAKGLFRSLFAYGLFTSCPLSVCNENCYSSLQRFLFYTSNLYHSHLTSVNPYHNCLSENITLACSRPARSNILLATISSPFSTLLYTRCFHFYPT